MCRWQWPAIPRCSLLAWLVWLAAPPLAAGQIPGTDRGSVRGTVPCGERCADFVVYLEGLAGRWDGAGEVAELGQKNKTFIPHVLPLLAGSTLRIGNDDPFMHNVHARREGKTAFNLNVLFQYQVVDQVVAEAGVYKISCEPHPGMSAVLVVLDNPFFTQPDEAGRYEIADVPAGRHEVVSLDAENGRRKSKAVQVGQGVVSLDF